MTRTVIEADNLSKRYLPVHSDSIYWEIPKSFDVNVEETLVYGTRRLERQAHGVTAARARVTIATR